MLMKIALDSTSLSESDQTLLLNDIWQRSIDEGNSFDQYIYLQLMNFYIIDKLIECSDFKICNMYLKNYQYIFYAFLDRISDIYTGINNAQDFEITMVEQGFEIFFQVKDHGEQLQIHAYDFAGNDVGEIENISKSEFKDVIDQIKKQYIQLIDELFDERFKFYQSFFILLKFNAELPCSKAVLNELF